MTGTPLRRRPRGKTARCLVGLLATWTTICGWATEPDPILIGLNADMSAVDERVGESIERGARIAIAEVNASGGVLGRPMELVIADHRRNPARGEINVRRLAANPDVVAIIGGKHTPVILAEIDTIHELGIPYLIPWAAGTPLIDHMHQPSYTFRLSIRDEFAGEVLVEQAIASGHRDIALLLEQTGWGRSNESGISRALRRRNLNSTRVEWFNWEQDDFGPSLDRLASTGADSIIFVGNAPEGIQFIENLADRPAGERLPVISHWGVVGEDFERAAGPLLESVDFATIQTFSFFDPPHPERARRVADAYLRMFPSARNLGDIIAPTGVAHAYDLVHLLALAIEGAGSTDRSRVRDALERLPAHAGLLKDYDPAFTPSRHEALDGSDIRVARFRDGLWRLEPSPR